MDAAPAGHRGQTMPPSARVVTRAGVSQAG